MNPEQLMIMAEEMAKGLEPSATNNLEIPTNMGQLIEAGIQFSIGIPNDIGDHEREMNALDRAFETDQLDSRALRDGLLEAQFSEAPPMAEKQAADRCEPPISCMSSYWAGPYYANEDIDEEEEEAISLEETTRLLGVLSKIHTMSPQEMLAGGYYRLHLGEETGLFAQVAQEAITAKLSPYFAEMEAWKDKAIKQMKRTHLLCDWADAEEAILEKYKVTNTKLATICLPIEEEEADEGFLPIVEDQFVIADRLGPWEREKSAHLAAEAERISKSMEPWYSRMYRGSKRNISGEEALHYKRLKEDREHRFEKAKTWIRQTTSARTLKYGLNKLEEVYKQSRANCFKTRNWCNVRYTKAQYAALKQNFREQLKEVNK